ncbi:DMT family transporter [bacterium]|nr:DMT family transporter [bacterium]
MTSRELDFKASLVTIHLPLLLTQLLFSTIPVSAKLAFHSFLPETVVFFRIAGSAALFLLLFATRFYQPVRNGRHLFSFAVFGFFGVVGNQYLFVKGVSYTSSINASILISTIPVFTIIFAVLGKKERLTISKLAGILVAMAGAGLLIGFEQLDFSGHIKGNLLILLNSSCFALYLVISKPMLRHYKPFTIMTYMYLFSTLEVLPLTIRQVLQTEFTSIPPAGYAPLAVIVFLGTFFPYLINKLILQKTESSVVAIYTYVQPVVGSLLAVLFLGETLSVKIVIATLFIFTGVTLVSFHRYISLPNLFQFKSGFRP